MKGLLDPNNKLGQTLGKITEMMLLNVLVLLCCLPIITAGAALTSMHSTLLNIYRDNDRRPVSDFFHAMKANLKNSTLLWLLYLGFLGILICLYWIVISHVRDGAVYIVFTLLAAACLGTILLTWALILQSRYNVSIADCLKSAVLVWAKYPGSTFVFLVALIIAVALWLVIYTLPLLLLLGFTLPGMLTTTLYHRVFIELEGKDLETPAAETD